MSAPLKTFRVTRVAGPPVPFQLVFEVPETEKIVEEVDDGDGPVWVERETGTWLEESRTFHAARRRLPAGLVLAVQEVDPADPASGARQAEALRKLIRVAVVEAEEFEAILNDDRTVVDPATLGEVVNWLIEQAAGRPTSSSAA